MSAAEPTISPVKPLAGVLVAEPSAGDASSSVRASTTAGRETVAVVIPTLNVASFIRPCLDALTWADEVHIVDMHSTDGTPEVVAAYPNVRYHARKDYIFANVNYGMEQSTTDWAIRLDSDEVIGDTLRDSILNTLRNPRPDISYYEFRGVNHMFGLPMRHGVGRPESSWRKHMFRRGTARYPCISEHEDIETTGKGARLDGEYMHYTNHTVHEVIRKFNYYTDRDIERMEPGSIAPMPPMRLLYHGFRMFVLYYWQWKGYKDGELGFYTSLYRGAIYPFIEEAKKWEARRLYESEEKTAARVETRGL